MDLAVGGVTVVKVAGGLDARGGPPLPVIGCRIGNGAWEKIIENVLPWGFLRESEREATARLQQKKGCGFETLDNPTLYPAHTKRIIVACVYNLYSISQLVYQGRMFLYECNERQWIVLHYMFDKKKIDHFPSC